MKKILVENVKDLGPLFAKNKYKMVGQDGAYSIPLEDNTLWFFGDTLLGERTSGESLWYPGGEQIGSGSMAGTGKITDMITNTALIVPNGEGEAILNEFEYLVNSNDTLKQLIPLHEDEDHDEIRIWCLHGIEIEDKIYLFYQKIRMLDEGDILPVNFEILGSGLAVGSKDTWEFKRLSFNNSDLFWNESQPQFAASVFDNSEIENWLYFYGVLKNSEGIQECYIARVEKDKIELREKYEYLSSPYGKWSFDVEKACPIFSGMPNELSVSFNSHLNCYLAIHSLDLTGKIVARTSEFPWGPWSEPTELFKVTVERKLDLPYPILIYAGKEHPEISTKNGKTIFVTYIEFEEYYPHLLKINLK